MQDFLNQKILVGICGGISAYKTAHLVSSLKKLGAQVKVVMTHAATKFISPLTFQALSGENVHTDLFENDAHHGMAHIALARWADVFIIVPASANTIAHMAHGQSPDLLSTLYLAATIPVIVCPAMNQSMWSHPATQYNIRLLKERHVSVIPPEVGLSACGELGQGRLCEIEHLLHFLRLAHLKPVLAGKTCVITAGPTRERIDPVRYLSNDSSGKMGYALAYAAYIAGAKVILISGPSALAPPPEVEFISVSSADAMYEAVMRSLTKNCIFIGAAAVADFKPTTVSQQKIKKDTRTSFTIDCIANPDILKAVSQSDLPAYLVGFAAETNELLTHAKKKLVEKKLDLIVANEVGENKGFDRPDNHLTLITADHTLPLPHAHKTRLAANIIHFISEAASSEQKIKRPSVDFF